jgi:hypothetical protein
MMKGPPEIPREIPQPGGGPPVPIPPVPLPDQISERWKGVYWAPTTYLRGHLFVHAIAFAVLAWSMGFQPHRYTPATLQGLFFLVQWLTPRQWAVAFGVIAILKLAAGFTQRLTVIAIIGGIVLVTLWTIGFGFAWIFDHSTALGFVAFGLLLGEHFAATTLVDGRPGWPPRGPRWPLRDPR